jgi:hypothetical protein
MWVNTCCSLRPGIANGPAQPGLMAHYEDTGEARSEAALVDEVGLDDG